MARHAHGMRRAHKTLTPRLEGQIDAHETLPMCPQGYWLVALAVPLLLVLLVLVEVLVVPVLVLLVPLVPLVPLLLPVLQ